MDKFPLMPKGYPMNHRSCPSVTPPVSRSGSISNGCGTFSSVSKGLRRMKHAPASRHRWKRC